MPTYIQKTTNSDLSPAWSNTTQFDKEMSAGTGTDTFVQVSLAASEIKSASFITIVNKPNSDVWEDAGTQTVEIEVDSVNMNIRARCRIVRLDSIGTILESGAFTGFQTLSASRIFNPVSPTWVSAEACDNRIAIEFEFENTDTMMLQSADIGLGTIANEVITDISEDGGTCGALAGARFLNQDGFFAIFILVFWSMFNV